MSKGKYVILGAGPTGLTAALHLAKDGYDVSLVEKSSRVGGFGASFEKDGFIFDYGPHTIHVKESEIIEMVKSILGDQIIFGKRRIQTLARGKYLFS